MPPRNNIAEVPDQRPPPQLVPPLSKEAIAPKRPRERFREPNPEKTPQELFIQLELHQILRIEENDRMITLFTQDIGTTPHPKGYFQLNVRSCDGKLITLLSYQILV